jgi:hypothetical protein
MSAYRTAERPRPRQLVLCPACATRVVVAPNDELCCQECGAREQALREDVELRSPIEVLDAETSAHTELRAAARAFGRDANAARLWLRCDGFEIILGIYIDSGVVRGVDYSLGTAGLPDVTFRREDDLDVMAKEREVARELQTGDDEFDRAVYIESDAPDAHLLTMLAAPAVRTAITSLVSRGLRVRIVEGTISTDDRATPECFTEERTRKIVSALRVIAGAPRSLERVVEEPRSGARVLAKLVYLCLPLGVLLLFVGSSSYPAISYGNLALAGGLAALIVAIAIQPLLTRAMRGRSTSHRELVPMRGVSFVGLVVLGIALSIFLNGALDRSAEWTEAGSVQSARYDDEDGTTIVTIRTPARTFEMTVADKPKAVRPGSPATIWLRAGAFGQPWEARPAVVESAAHQ